MVLHSAMNPPSWPTPDIPELSRLAWARLIAELGSVDYPCEHQALRLAALPSAGRLLEQPAENWVTRYESLREAVEKTARRQGHAQTGVFYTPPWVARYLTQQTLGNALNHVLGDVETAALSGQWEQAHRLLNTAKQWRIIDPACGTGVFLLEACVQLYAFYQRVNALFLTLGPAPVIEHAARHILQSQVYGVDIDPLSVMLAEWRLVQWASRLEPEKPGDVLRDLQAHLRCGNTLADVLFSNDARWQVVLGNPPYISETRRQAQRFRALQTQGQGYYQAKMDLCDAFLAWAIHHLEPSGRLAFVLPEYWTQRSSTRSLREQFWTHGTLCEFWKLTGQRVFKQAPGHHSSLLIWQKTGPMDTANSTQTVAMGVATRNVELTAERLQNVLFTLDSASGKLRYGNPVESGLLETLSTLPPLLAKHEIQQGLVMPQGRLKQADWHRLLPEIQAQVSSPCGVFLLTDDEVAALNLTAAERALLKPYYGPAGFQAFRGFSEARPIHQLIYGSLENRKRIEKHPWEYPHIRAHLERFQTINTSAFAPYGLHRPRQSAWFEDVRKILCPRQVLRPAMAVVDFPAYVNEGFYILRPVHWEPDYGCGVLNSTLAWFWFYKHKRKGDRLQIDKDVLSVFPAPNSSQTQQARVSELSRQLALRPDDGALYDALNQQVYAIYQLTNAEIEWVEAAYQAIVLGK